MPPVAHRPDTDHPAQPEAGGAVPHRPGSARLLSEELVALAVASGCAVAGIASAHVFSETRAALHERRDRGLHAGMQFTYRNPDRSTDPTRILPGARALVVGALDYRRTAAPSEASGCGAPATGRGRVAEYACRDFYGDLRKALQPVADRLRRAGWQATVVCDDNALVDRAAAHRAGL
ncbi:MAG: DUF1730 domain-containing protein, partial [Acidimicrobiales bacterium]|nr:DUF1730 domain-containing protein [Acidimicrobiales bacterium]